MNKPKVKFYISDKGVVPVYIYKDHIQSFTREVVLAGERKEKK